MVFTSPSCRSTNAVNTLKGYINLVQHYKCLKMAKAYSYGVMSPAADVLYCILFGSAGLNTMTMNSAKIGLVVITIERYFKVAQHE